MIVDEEGNELSSGKSGEVLFKSPNQMKGYFNKEEDTRKTILNGWVYTVILSIVMRMVTCTLSIVGRI